MGSIITVSRDELKATKARADTDFGVFYEGVAAASINGKTAAHEAALKRHGAAFGATFSAVKKAIDQRSAFADILGDQQVPYAAYVAASALSDVRQTRLPQQLTQTIAGARTSGALMRSTLEGLLDAYVQNDGGVHDITRLYFSGVAAAVGAAVKDELSTNVCSQLTALHWTINDRSIAGLPITRLQHQTVSGSDKSSEYESQAQPAASQNLLLPIKFAPGRVLHREEIIGDNKILAELERQARNLSFYDRNALSNPLKEAGLFANRYVLQGRPGTGKSEVIFYIAEYARKEAEKAGIPVEVVRFNFDSAWKDGNTLSAQHQFNRICSGDKLYIIVQDELGSLFSKRATTDMDGNKMEKEFLRFASGDFPDRGNYLLLGTLNDIADIPAAVIRAGRWRSRTWEGASSPLEIGHLLRTKLAKSVHSDCLPISEKQYADIGAFMHQYGLSGADATEIANLTKERSLDWNYIDANVRQGPYASRLASVRRAYSPITFNGLIEATNEHIESRTRCLTSSEEQR